MTYIRPLMGTVLLCVSLAMQAGCGDDPPPSAPAVPSGPPGNIELTITDASNFPARKIEVRLLAPPRGGQLSTGGELQVYSAPSVRDQKEGPDMTVVQKLETNDFGKVKLPNVAPGDYLLSVGTINVGIVRQWIKMDPSQTMTTTIKLPGRGKQQ